MKRNAILAAVAAAIAGAAALTPTAASGSTESTHPPGPQRPSKVLVVLFDQMRPEYADRFDMPNFRALRDQGRDFKNAYLGYMASETVIAHNVLVAGQQPRHMGWVDEAYRDTKGLLGAPNQMWITGELSYDQYGTLIQDAGYPKLADYLQQADPGSKFIVVGQKGYAVESIAAETAFDTSDADIAVRFGSRSSSAPAPGSEEAACKATLGGRFRGPSGINVPTYLSQPYCGRFYVNSDSANAYGTDLAFPSWIYPLDGNRNVPGTDPAHLGGDTWVADAAIAMMENEDWSGMFVTMAGIDKAGHMWGANRDTQTPPGSLDYQTHVQFNAENADVQLGRLVAKLQELGQLDDTLIVLTADHGATHAADFYGKTSAGASDTNWYYGPDSLPTSYNDPSPKIAPLLATGNVQFSYQSTAIEAWLKDASPGPRREAIQAMSSLPGVMATYCRKGSRYVLADRSWMTRAEQRWWSAKGQSIINNMAGPSGADVVGLLHDNVSYGAYGDHGGANQEVQEVPMVFWSASMRHGRAPGVPFRTYDVMPTILRALGLPEFHPTDGRAWNLR